MNNIDILKNHIYSLDLDIRTPSNGRWTTPGRCFDQKNVPELISFAAECINKYTNEVSVEFTNKDIENMEFYKDLYQTYFGKPPVEKTKNESDKFIGQQTKLFTAAKILIENSEGRQYKYKVANKEILEMLIANERNSFDFLRLYLQKLLTDSGIIYVFDEYFDKQRKGRLVSGDYSILRDKYSDYIISNTPINKIFEPRRMVNKITNIFALNFGLRGQEKGSPSKHVITFQDLLYRRENSQDSGKRKGMSRDEYRKILSNKNTNTAEKNAKDDVKDYQGFISEYNGESNALEAHHILPKADFPEFVSTRENLIVLTPNQHRVDAHPNSNFRKVDPVFQIEYLLKKLKNIEFDENENNDFYNKVFFVDMLNQLFTENFEFTSSYSILEKFLTQRLSVLKYS